MVKEKFVCIYFKCQRCGEPLDAFVSSTSSYIVTPCAVCLEEERATGYKVGLADQRKKDA